MKKLLLLILLTVSSTAFANDFKIDCSFDDGRETVVATSTEYDFLDPFQSAYMPTSAYFEGKTPELYVVEGKFSDGTEEMEQNFFVTKKLPLSNYSAAAKELLSEMVPLEAIKTVRLSFLTDLYATFTYAEVELVDGNVLKVAVAGLSFGECK